MRWKRVLPLGLGLLLATAALVNLYDGYPDFFGTPRQLVALSAVERHGMSLSPRERGAPHLRRGLLHLPDLFPCRIEAPGLSVRRLEMKVAVPPGSWFDLLLDVGEAEHTLVRLSRLPGGSMLARVPREIGVYPAERELAISDSCLGEETDLSLELEDGAARLRAGACGPVEFEHRGAGALGFASGLAGVDIGFLAVSQALADGSGRTVIVPETQVSRRLLLPGGAIFLSLLGVVLIPRLAAPRRLRAWRPEFSRLGPALMLWFLAALPVFSWLASLFFFLCSLAALAAVRPREPVPDSRPARPALRPLPLAVAVLTLPCLVNLAVPLGPVSGPRILLRGEALPLSLGRDSFPDSRRGTALEVEAPGEGAFRVIWGLPDEVGAAGEEPMSPKVYPDLGWMLPSLLLEKRPSGVDWYLSLGDLVSRSGTVSDGAGFSVVHRRGILELRQGERLLARLRGVPARAGGVRILPLKGGPAPSLTLIPQGFSRFGEIYLGLGVGLFLLSLPLLLAGVLPGLRVSLYSLFGFPFAFTLFAVALNAFRDSWLPVALGWTLVPFSLVLVSLALAALQLRNLPRSPLPSLCRCLGFLALPSLLVPVFGGPAAARFTGPWYASVRSTAVIPSLDPEARLFNDTALTGLYHGRQISPAVPAGVRRLLVLGGSQTFGEGFSGARPPQLWTSLLEEELSGVEVLNLAVEGSTLSSQVERLRGLLQEQGGFSGVLAVFGMNDGTLLRRSATVSARIDQVLAGKSPLLVDPCGAAASCNLSRRLSYLVPLFTGRGTGTVEERRRTLEAAIQELRRLAEEHGLRLWLVREPQQCDLTECEAGIAGYRLPHGFDLAAGAIEAAARQGIPVIDPRVEMRRHRARIPFFDLVHLSEEGHRVMARLLGERLGRESRTFAR